MKISYNWLKQFIKTDWSAEDTGELLTNLGLEVGAIDLYKTIKGSMEGVVVGEVLSCKQHPNADRLKLTTVALDNEKQVQIVCGAPNVAEGQKVLVATIGTTLYTKEGKPWKIKKGKIRGQESHGMICAEDELGLGTSHDGIMVLDNKTKIGTLASSLFDIEDDFIFDIDLTPNRADAMSHYGVARDFRAGLIQKDVSIELITPSASAFHVSSRILKIDIDIQDKIGAPRYCAITLSNLKVKESPEWLKHRLKSIGLSPINNIVDVTNYVMHELGQPLHAFDAAKIANQKVIVKRLPRGTKFTTLDEVERELHEEDLMICDGNEQPMCIAGVFGGLNSGVNNQTTSIFLESAYFNPISIRKTAKYHGLNTDASFRFERGIDPNITAYALKRAALMLIQLAEGEISSDLIDEYPVKIENHQVVITYKKIDDLIGKSIPREAIKSILTSLDITINNVTETGLGLTIPAYRNDVLREVDVIEELLRIYGYNRIDVPERLNTSIPNFSKFDDHNLRQLVANQLVAQGFYEILTNSLTQKSYSEITNLTDPKASISITNPLSQDLGVLRQHMLFNGLEAIRHNINRKQDRLKLFEFGKTYEKKGKSFREFKHLAVLITGIRTNESWTDKTKPTDFYYLKGIVMFILERLGIINIEEIHLQNDIFTEGLTLQHGDTKFVDYGIISKSICTLFDINQKVFFANFYWDNVILKVPIKTNVFKPIPKYPKVKRDFALLLDDTVSYKSLKDIAFNTEKKCLKSMHLFDVYTGRNIPKGKKSYAISFVLQDDNKTLTDKQIDKIMKKLETNFKKKLGAELR